MSPAELRGYIKAATEQAGAEADAILERSDRAEALCDAAIEMLSTGDAETALKLASRAIEVGGPAWLPVRHAIAGGES